MYMGLGGLLLEGGFHAWGVEEESFAFFCLFLFSHGVTQSAHLPISLGSKEGD